MNGLQRIEEFLDCTFDEGLKPKTLVLCNENGETHFKEEDVVYLTEQLLEMAGLGWQPIESAPKDGTDVLLSSNGFIEVGHYRSGEWQNVDSSCTLYPTHWRPLPQAPKVKP